MSFNEEIELESEEFENYVSEQRHKELIEVANGIRQSIEDVKKTMPESNAQITKAISVVEKNLSNIDKNIAKQNFGLVERCIELNTKALQSINSYLSVKKIWKFDVQRNSEGLIETVKAVQQ